MNTFRQLRNDLRDIEAIADGYKTKIGHDLWLSDGLQKDAVQNSWDARIDRLGMRLFHYTFCRKRCSLYF